MQPLMKPPRVLAFAVFLTCVSTLCAQDFSEEEKRSIFERFEEEDVDGDNSVSKEEMFRAVLIRAATGRRIDQRQAALQVHWTFQRIDANADGKVTLAEIHADIAATKQHLQSIKSEDRKLYEGRFSQCSYNAVSSTLIHFHGATPSFRDRSDMEKTRFNAPLNEAGMGAFFGWVPWTSFMINSHKIDWNGTVNDLTAENFSCRPRQLPSVDADQRKITVRYDAGEREQLEKKMLSQLQRGPVMIWTPYAAVLSPVPQRWNHVEHVDDTTDVVPYGPFTHAVTCFLKPDGRVVVCDGAVQDGIFYSDVPTLVATASAMPAFIRISSPRGGTTVFDRCRGIQDEQFNVVVFKSDRSPQ